MVKRVKRTASEVTEIPGFSKQAMSQATEANLSKTKPQKFRLQSGKEAVFTLENMPAEKVKSHTFIDEKINGRIQKHLSEESLSDIISTIQYCQFYPVIGVQREGKIEFLDGSRRRMSAIFAKVGITALVTRDDISVADARALSKQLQTAKEHNLRELGLQLKVMRDEGSMEQKEIAEQNGLSESKVTRALHAADVSDRTLLYFSDLNELFYPDYKALLDIEKAFEKGALVQDSFYGLVDKDVEKLSEIDRKNNQYVINIFKRNMGKSLGSKDKPETKKTILKKFKDKNVIANMKVTDQKQVYEFNNLPLKLASAIEESIRSILEAQKS